MAPRRYKSYQDLNNVKNKISKEKEVTNKRKDYSCGNGDLSRIDSKTTKVQKKQIVLPEKFEESLKLIGLDDSSTYTKDEQIKGLLNHLKDSKVGTYVKCCVCSTWFFLLDVKDVLDIPDFVTCSSHAIKRQTIQRLGKTWSPDHEKFEELSFSCGSIVWAKQGKCVMWPGMVDFCPDNYTFTWMESEQNGNHVAQPQWYNVVFFSGSSKSKVTRCWIKAEHISPFSPSKTEEFVPPKKPSEKEKYDQAIRLASKAHRLGTQERLNQYSFVSQFDGVFGNKVILKKKGKKSKIHWRKLRKINEMRESETKKETVEDDDNEEENQDSFGTNAVVPNDTLSIYDEISKQDFDAHGVIDDEFNLSPSKISIPMSNSKEDDNKDVHSLDDSSLESFKKFPRNNVNSLSTHIDSTSVKDAIISSEESENEALPLLNNTKATFLNEERTKYKNYLAIKHIAQPIIGIQSQKSLQICDKLAANEILPLSTTYIEPNNIVINCDNQGKDMCEEQKSEPSELLPQLAGVVNNSQNDLQVDQKVENISSKLSIKSWSKCDKDIENINEGTNSSTVESSDMEILSNEHGNIQNLSGPSIHYEQSKKVEEESLSIPVIAKVVSNSPVLNFTKQYLDEHTQNVESPAEPTDLSASIPLAAISPVQESVNNTNIDLLSHAEEGLNTNMQPRTFSKPPLTANMLVMIAIQNEPCIRSGEISQLITRDSTLSRSKIIDFLQYHFPFFVTQSAMKRDYAKKLVVEVLKDVKEGEQICIQLKDLEEFYPLLRSACDEKLQDILNSMRCPYMLEFFLLNCQPKPTLFRKPPFSYLALVDIAISYLAKLHPETVWIHQNEVVTFIQTVFPFFSQKAGSYGRVSFEPSVNNSKQEIHKFINNNLRQKMNQDKDVLKKSDSRGGRRITYDTMNGKLKFVQRPERIRELAKNLWKMKKSKHLIPETTINHLLNAFPELMDLIKENEDCSKSTLNQNSKITSIKEDSVQMNRMDETTNKKGDISREKDTAKLRIELPKRNKRKKLEKLLPQTKRKKCLQERRDSFSSTSSNSSKLSIQSEPRKTGNLGKEYDYVNNIEPYDLTLEEDQESIDQLEADLMDESLIELTNIL